MERKIKQQIAIFTICCLNFAFKKVAANSKIGCLMLDFHRVKASWEDFCLGIIRTTLGTFSGPKNVADYLEDRATNTWWGISGEERE